MTEKCERCKTEPIDPETSVFIQMQIAESGCDIDETEYQLCSACFAGLMQYLSMTTKTIKKILSTCCPHCEYDEAEGGLINHCDKCCRRIVTKLCKEAK